MRYSISTYHGEDQQFYFVYYSYEEFCNRLLSLLGDQVEEHHLNLLNAISDLSASVMIAFLDNSDTVMSVTFEIYA